MVWLNDLKESGYGPGGVRIKTNSFSWIRAAETMLNGIAAGESGACSTMANTVSSSHAHAQMHNAQCTITITMET